MTRCPRDREVLTSKDVTGYRYYSCERCGGYWIPGASLLCVLSARGMGELRRVPSAGKSEIDCPDCRAECEVLMVEGCRLDSCVLCHGIWLDSGEVRRVKRLFPEGSAVVNADEDRVSKEADEAFGTISVVTLVGELLSVFW